MPNPSPIFSGLLGRLASGGSCLLCAMAASAAETPRLSEEAYLGDVPVVLTASRLSQRIDEAPAAVTVIDREMIKNSGAWDLSEVFRLVPGMFVAYHADRFYATDSTVSYHGLVTNTMSHRMQVLVDGRTVYSPLYGGVIWSDIPVALDDIERIEVIRGPDSASYGANSFMGVINIITRHPAEAQGKFASLAAGRGRAEGVLRYGGRQGDLSYRVTAGARNDHGEDSAIVNPAGKSYIWASNKFDDKQIRLLTLRADYQVNSSDDLEFNLGYNGGPRQAGEIHDIVAQNKQAENHSEQLRWRRALAGGGELAVQFFHSVESSRTTLLDESDGSLYNGDARASRYDLEVQHTFSPTPATRLVWGGSVRHDSTYAPYYLGVRENTYMWDDRSFNLRRLFGNLEWRIHPDLVVNAGAMVENNSYTGSDVSPRIAANWHFRPGHTLRVGYSQATRTPSVYEKVYEEYWRAANHYPALAPLVPERVDSVDLGYLGKLGRLDVDFRLFHDTFRKLISAEPQTAAENGNLNGGSAIVKGFETQLKWDIAPGTRLVYGLSHGIVSSPNTYNVQYTNSMPTNSQSLMLTHAFTERWHGSIVGYQVGETHFSDTDYDPRDGRNWFIAAHQRWDARLAYAFRSGNANGEVALIVQNLADARYFEYRHDNQPPGRIAWVNLKLGI